MIFLISVRCSQRLSDDHSYGYVRIVRCLYREARRDPYRGAIFSQDARCYYIKVVRCKNRFSVKRFKKSYRYTACLKILRRVVALDVYVECSIGFLRVTASLGI